MTKLDDKNWIMRKIIMERLPENSGVPDARWGPPLRVKGYESGWHTSTAGVTGIGWGSVAIRCEEPGCVEGKLQGNPGPDFAHHMTTAGPRCVVHAQSYIIMRGRDDD